MKFNPIFNLANRKCLNAGDLLPTLHKFWNFLEFTFKFLYICTLLLPYFERAFKFF